MQDESTESPRPKRKDTRKRDRREYNQQRYAANIEKERARHTIYREAHREELKEQARRRYAESPERRTKQYAASQRWAAKNLERVRERHKRSECARRQRHPELVAQSLTKLQAWIKAHPERVAAARKRYKLTKRPEQYASSTLRRQAVRLEMIMAYGGACDCCGETETAFLTLDHVHGDGAAHRREVVGPRGRAIHAQELIIRQLRATGWPQDGRFRILCWNCQWGTRRPKGCPHHATADRVND